MASLTSNKFRTLLLNNGINLLSDTIKVALVTSAHTPAKGDNFMDTYTASELSGTGYTAGFGGSGRKTLATKAVAQDDTNGWGTFDADDVTWSAINAGTAAAAVLLKEITSDAASPIIAVVVFSSAVTTNGGDFTIQWANTGAIFNFG